MNQRVKSFNRLPRIKIDISSFVNFADRNGRVLMESEIPGLIHVSVKGEGTAIVSGERGYLVVTEEDLPTLIEELEEIADQMRLRRAYG